MLIWEQEVVKPHKINFADSPKVREILKQQEHLSQAGHIYTCKHCLDEEKERDSNAKGIIDNS